MKLRSLFIAVLSLLVLVGSLLAPATAARAADCPSVGDKLPVLFVHGFNEGPAVWNNVLARIGSSTEIKPSTFDYSKDEANLQWVTDPRIGPTLVSRINCEAASTRLHKIAVVAHSMGGDAVLEALREDPSIANKLGVVITIGTPNQGSEFAKSSIKSAQDFCNSWGGYAAKLCDAALRTLLQQYSALPALAADSSQMKQLPSWPSNVPVLAIAGNIRPTFTVPLTPFTTLKIHGPYSGTDGMVTASSALHGNKTNGLGGAFEYHCTTSQPVVLPIITPADCEHNALLRSKAIKDTVANEIQEAVKKLALPPAATSAPPTTATSCPSAGDIQQAAKSYFDQQGTPTDSNTASDIVCEGDWAAASLSTKLKGGGETDGAVLLKRNGSSWKVTSVGSGFDPSGPECTDTPPRVRKKLCG